MTAISSDPAATRAAGHADTPAAVAGPPVLPDPVAYAAEAMYTILASGQDRLNHIRRLSELRDFFDKVARIVSNETAVLIAEERLPRETFVALADRLGGVKADRIADLVRRGELILKAADDPAAAINR